MQPGSSRTSATYPSAPSSSRSCVTTIPYGSCRYSSSVLWVICKYLLDRTNRFGHVGRQQRVARVDRQWKPQSLVCVDPVVALSESPFEACLAQKGVHHVGADAAPPSLEGGKLLLQPHSG